ncbi:MAG: metal-sensing transcriptional repressor [Polyangiales bacterium]|nr:metal-sensing transcriptional repressor [Myxococcales bacterium]MCB9658079.1 metal-sensing transcriptional repressor [Sandaracinaceae bacterium]
MHALDESNKAALGNRLARIEGQVRGLRKLIEQDADCEKVAQQMAAARKALDKTYHELLACMIERELRVDGQSERAAKNLAQVRALLSKYG